MIEEEELVEEIPSEEEDKETGVPIYKIVSYPSDPTLEVINEKWLREEILVLGFQRRWVWTHAQASKLIDSFLLGLPVPPIFVYKLPSQIQVVIDGQQRLRTIHGFFSGELPGFYLPQFFRGDGASQIIDGHYSNPSNSGPSANQVRPFQLGFSVKLDCHSLTFSLLHNIITEN